MVCHSVWWSWTQSCSSEAERQRMQPIEWAYGSNKREPIERCNGMVWESPAKSFRGAFLQSWEPYLQTEKGRFLERERWYRSMRLKRTKVNKICQKEIKKCAMSNPKTQKKMYRNSHDHPSVYFAVYWDKLRIYNYNFNFSNSRELYFNLTSWVEWRHVNHLGVPGCEFLWPKVQVDFSMNNINFFFDDALQPCGEFLRVLHAHRLVHFDHNFSS